MSSKRPKLSGAFSQVPVPRVETPHNITHAATATKTAVYMLPPTITKFNSGVPVAMLKARDCGPVVTIAKEKKPSFTFGGALIDDKPVGGFSYIGFSHVKGGDSAPQTGALGHAVDTRPAYVLKSGKLFADRKLSEATVDATIAVPMSGLGGMWGEINAPTIVLASNTNALFNMPSFHEAKEIAAGNVDIGAVDAVSLIAADNPKRLETEKAVVSSPLPYLPYLSKYVMLLNPPPNGKYGAVVLDVAEVSATRPLKLTLQHASKESRTVVVEVWPSTLAEAGLDAKTLCVTPVIAYISASLDPWSGDTKLIIGALAAPPPDLASYVAFAKSVAMKSHFNDLGHTAEEAKSREQSVDQILMNEGRAIPLKFARAGVANTLLLDKPAALGLVKSHAASMAREQAVAKGVLDVVKTADDDAIIAGILGIDKVTGAVTLENLMHKINAEMDDADDSQQVDMVCAATFLHALLAGGKATVEDLRPLVYGYKQSGDDDGDDEESDFEAGEEEGEDLGGNL
jgi:uncharacterized metal-binding protein